MSIWWLHICRIFFFFFKPDTLSLQSPSLSLCCDVWAMSRLTRITSLFLYSGTARLNKMLQNVRLCLRNSSKILTLNNLGKRFCKTRKRCHLIIIDQISKYWKQRHFLGLNDLIVTRSCFSVFKEFEQLRKAGGVF